MSRTTPLSPSRRWLNYWTREVRRLWVPLAAIALIGYYRHQLDQNSETARILYKVNIVSGAVVLAHMLRSQVFPYISLNELRHENAQAFLGASILIGLFMLAVILAFALGL